MQSKLGRVAAVVVLMSIFLGAVAPCACEASILYPVNAVTNAVAKTTKKVAKTSVGAVKTVVAAPKKVVTKVGRTLSGK
jgi:hypothetical protein